MNAHLSQTSSPSIAITLCVLGKRKTFPTSLQCSFSHRKTQMNRTHRISERWWPLPRPLPRREGEWSPRFPYRVDVGFVLSLISIYDSFNALWYLYARGVLWVRNVRKEVLLNLWVLWEKEISFVKDKTPHTTPNVLFLTEEHRWTEHTNAHRDIKSTDFTEPYNQR